MTVPDGARPLFTVVICTRDRPRLLADALAGLRGQRSPAFPVLVVDQGGGAAVAASSGLTRVSVIVDPGQGLSRARNIGWRSVKTDWAVFLDDDCIPAQDWSAELHRAVAEHGHADFIGTRVDARLPAGNYAAVTASGPMTAGLRRGRWARPWDIGLGACMAVRRTAIERLGGWDERLGAGTRRFPAAEDMDFNFRLLCAGGTAYVAPAVRVEHQQWREPDALAALFRDYMTGWAGFSMKHLRRGDLAGGSWLWALGVADLARTVAGAAKRRSRQGLVIAMAKARGLALGTARGLVQRW